MNVITIADYSIMAGASYHDTRTALNQFPNPNTQGGQVAL